MPLQTKAFTPCAATPRLATPRHTAHLRLHTLYSGSSGNSVYVKMGNTELLFDIGCSCRATVKALHELNVAPENIDAIFITHEHSDHIAGAEVFWRRYGTPIHILHACAARAKCEVDFITHPSFFEERFDGVVVRSFPTPHDSGGSVGYTVENGTAKFGIATDMGHIADGALERLVGCHAAVIESNYDEEMLCFGPYPPELKWRIASRYGHLSNGDGAKLAGVLAEHGTEHILLAHLSKENNTPGLALAAAHAELSRRGLTASVRVADRDTVTRFYERSEE